MFFELYWRQCVKDEGYPQPRRLFIAKKGEVLILHANLLHGGSSVKQQIDALEPGNSLFFEGCAYTTLLWQNCDAGTEGNQWRQQQLNFTKLDDSGPNDGK